MNIQHDEGANAYSVDIGCMWDGNPWDIALRVKLKGEDPKCRHCVDTGEETRIRFWDKSTIVEQTWVCPRVVIATNQGGHDTTGVCLDCILDAVKALEGLKQ